VGGDGDAEAVNPTEVGLFGGVTKVSDGRKYRS